MCARSMPGDALWGKLWGRNKKRAKALDLLDYLAERVGFEPTVDLHPRLISSQVHSTTLPPLRDAVGEPRALGQAHNSSRTCLAS